MTLGVLLTHSELNVLSQMGLLKSTLVVVRIKRERGKRLTFHMLLLLSHFSRVRLCDPIDGSPPGSPVPEILQARTLEWVAVSFSNA